VDKQRVAENFGRAAECYDSSAGMQREVGERLLERLPSATPRFRCVVDLGCGTGYYTHLLAQRYLGSRVLGLDLSPGMLRYACNHRPLSREGHWLAGDAENLPLQDESVDLIFSNMALQWCDNFHQVLSEAQRVLRPGGMLLFSTLTRGTLQELREAWRCADQFSHVNEFPRVHFHVEAIEQTGFQSQDLASVRLVYRYRELRQITRELKSTGVNTVHASRSTGLTSRQRIRSLAGGYERFRQADGLLPLTWEVLLGALQKPA
jgi:malonyl-CoA O-methyltransferase